MTQTIQPNSGVTLGETEKEVNENNKKVLLSVFDSMTKLCEAMNNLNNVIQRKNLEQILSQEKTGGVK